MKMENKDGGAILTMVVAQSSADTITDWVAENLEKTVVGLKKPGGAEVVLEIYFKNRVEAEVASLVLKQFQSNSMSIREYKNEEWTESWKKHFKPMDIGEKLRVCPPWLAGKSDRIELVINPGLSFGTGNHFTTCFCLEQLDRFVQQSGAKTLADIGTGSGILSIAAIKLGVEIAVGTDFDPLCVEQAIKNAEVNGVSKETNFFQHDITEGNPFPDKHDIVCANIYSSVLIDNAVFLLDMAKKYLFLTGIRDVELDGVADTFVRLGAKEIVRDCGGEWSGLVMEIV